MRLHGRIKVGERTKHLTPRLSRGDIAVIKHDDIDELAAIALIDAGVKAVINTGTSMTGRFFSRGTGILFENHIKVIDTTLSIRHFTDEDIVTVYRQDLIINHSLYKASCIHVDASYINSRTEHSRSCYRSSLSSFVDNTLQFAGRDSEKLIHFDHFPKLNTSIKDKHVLIVVRNCDTLTELSVLSQYINRYSPILLAVDGGADILLKRGYTPDIVLGDMDSVTDLGIYKSKEVILHAYENGYCPCLERISKMCIPYKIISIPGTSEDIAMLLAFNNEAELIVLAGGHNCPQDFLSKGRQGMGSTLLVRMIVGDRLVDCRGLNRILAVYEDERDRLCLEI